MSDKPLVLQTVTPGYSQNNRPFISICGGKPTVFFNRPLAKELGIVEGMNVAFYSDNSSEDKKYIWALFITKNTTISLEVRNGSRPNTLRVSSKKWVEQLSKTFRVTEGKTVRLYVNTKNPIEINDRGEQVKIYIIFDIPPLRQDLSGEELVKYNEEYLEQQVKLKQYGISKH
jgi:anaerobic selenocysteine-containing dehydrogenase